MAGRFYLDNRRKYYYNMGHVAPYKPLYSGRGDVNANKENSVWSDGNDSFIYGQSNANASRGTYGMQANASTSASMLKHSLDDFDIHLGQGTARASTSLGITGAHAGLNAELNVLSVEHENLEARLGLDVSTGAGISVTDVTFTMFGAGFNAGLNGIGVSTPLGSIKWKR